MASKDWDSIVAGTPPAGARDANAAVAGTYGVTPAQGAAALTDGPMAGTPPSVGMRTPQQTSELAAQAQRSSVLEAHPAVASWMAGADPAHVAASKDSLPDLAKVNYAAQAWNGYKGPVDDFLGPIQQALADATRAQNALDTSPDLGTRALAIPEALRSAGALALSPFAGLFNTVLNPAGRALSSQTDPSTAGGLAQLSFGLNLINPLASDEATAKSQQTAQAGEKGKLTTADVSEAYSNVLSAYAVAVGGKKAAEGGGPPPVRDLGTAEIRPSRAPEPTGPVTDAEFADIIRPPLAIADQRMMEFEQQEVANSGLHTASPSTMRAFLSHAHGDEIVSVDPDALVGLARSGEEPFPDRAQEIARASQAGTDVEIPRAEYVSATAGQPFAQELNAATTFREGGVSTEEGKGLAEPKPAAEEPTGAPPVPEGAFEGLTSPETSRAKSIAAAYSDTISRALEPYLAPLVKGPDALGMTKPQFERYSASVEALVERTQARAYEAARAQVMRERKPDFVEAAKQHSADVGRELAARRDVQAQHALVRNTGPLGEPLERPPMKINREDALNAYGSQLVNSVHQGVFGAKGLHPDEVAELLGYGSGREMIGELAALHDQEVRMGAEGKPLTPREHLATLAKAIGHDRAAESLGFDLSPEGIHEAASAMVHEPDLTSFLTDELRAMGATPLEIEDVKARAAERFSYLTVKDARNIKKLEGNLYKTSRKLQDALQKGDARAAFIRAQQQFLHHLVLREAHDFAKTFRVADKSMSRLARKPIAKGMDQEARNFARFVVRQLGYNVLSGKYEGVDAALRGKSLEAYLGELAARGTPSVNAELPQVPPNSPQSLPVRTYLGGWDMVKSLSALGRWMQKVFSEGKSAELADIVSQIKENANAIGRPFTAGEMRRLRETVTRGVPGKVARNVGSIIARPETYLYWLDGETNGPLMRYVVSELENGKFYKADTDLAMAKRWKEFSAGQPTGWDKSLDAKVNVPELVYSVDKDGAPVPWLQRRSDIIMMATHFGTESNFSKLTEGFGWDPDVVRAVANRELTKADWDYVQFILDQHKELLPKVQDLYRATVGLGLDPVEATAIPTPHGMYPGGYRHVTYDWGSIGEFEGEDGAPIEVRDPNALGTSELFGSDYRVSTPPNKYTVARTNFSAPLNLDHAILHTELEAVIHDLAYRKALIQAAKIMAQPAVRQAFREALGPEYLSETNRWLQDVARQASYDQGQLKFFASLVRGFRRRFTMVQIGYNLATLGKHGLIAASHIDGEVGIPRFAKAAGDLMGPSPEGGARWREFVDSNSGEVRGALVNLDRDVRELIQDAFRKQGYLDTIRYNAFTMFAVVKQVEARATWLAKYRQLTEEQGLEHGDAVALSNKAVRDTQGAGGAVDLPSLWRADSSFWAEVGKLLNVFTNFENTGSNRIWTMMRRGPRMIRGFKDEGWAGGRRDFNKILNDSKAYFIVPAILATAFGAVTVGDDKHFIQNYFENLMKSTLGGSVPGGNMLADLPRMIASRDHSFQGDAIGEALQSLVKTGVAGVQAASGHGDKVDKRWVQHAAETAGYLTNFPTKPVAKGGQYLWNITHGKESTGPADFARGVMFGPKVSEGKSGGGRGRGSRR